MNILVVGGAGYIGSVMTHRLIERGHRAIVLDNFSTGNLLAVPGTAPIYEGDMGDPVLQDRIFSAERINIVMHFAAKIAVGESMERPDFYYSNNLVKTLSLLDGMHRHGIMKFIFSSTAAVYGEPVRLPIDEQHPTLPINPYGRSKRMVETVLEDYSRAFGLRCVIFRYFNAAGASLDGSRGESQKIKQNLIPIVLENVEKRRATTIFGDEWNTPDGTCIRDYIHVEDIVSAHMLAAEKFDSLGRFEILNLGSQSGASVGEVLDCVERVGAFKVERSIGPRREGDAAKVIASSQKARRELGWNPQYSDLDTIIRSAIQWHFNRRF